jgi:ATP-dependent RNA/DNA helicase IGHMBP2
MIVRLGVTNKTTKAVSGIDRDYAPVCADLADGWTLCPREKLALRPARLHIIGRRFSYLAQLSGYCLPEGLCSCERSPCRCQGVQLKAGDAPGELLLIEAFPRTASDSTAEDVAHYPRYQERFNRSTEPLNQRTLALFTERWNRAHLTRAAAHSGRIARWKQLNEIRAWVARERGAIVQLAEEAWDPERFAEGQLVLLTNSPAATASAARDFVYRLPRLDVALRVEDVGETELIIDCGEQDLVRVEQYLRSQQGRPLRLTLDTKETDKQIKRERRTLLDAQADQRLRGLIGDPTLARRVPEREPVEFINPELDLGQQQVVTAAVSADDLLVVQGPPGTGKTTAICEIVWQYLAKDPHAQILIAAQTHQAVDNVLLRLAKQDPDLPIVRLASEKTVSRVEETIRDRYWIDHTEPWYPPIVRRAWAYRHLIEARTQAGDITPDELTGRVDQIQNDYLASVGPQRTSAERLAQARVIAGTCSGISGHPEVGAMRFPIAILEEAGKATPPEALMLMLRAQKNILVGDTRQLPPHTWKAMQEALHSPHKLTSANPNFAEEAEAIRSQISALGSTPQEREAADEETLFGHFTEHLTGTEHEATLHTQYRMLPPIGELVSHCFYSDIGGLNHGRKNPIDPRVTAFTQDVRVRLVDIPGPSQKEGKSTLRVAEVDHIRRELRALQEHVEGVPPPPKAPERLGVAVITPYAAQARRLTQRLDLTQYPDLNVRIGIVDRFQGDEDQVVILSMAATTAAGFLKTPNRINVAISRAQDLLIITTDQQQALAGKIGEPFQRVARFIDEHVKHGDTAYDVLKPPQANTRRRAA